MGDRHAQYLPFLALGGKGQRVVLYPEANPLASILKVIVTHQDTGQESSLTEDLEAIADAENEPSLSSKALYGRHYGGKASYSPRSKVISIGEAAREDNTIVA